MITVSMMNGDDLAVMLHINLKATLLRVFYLISIINSEICVMYSKLAEWDNQK